MSELKELSWEVQESVQPLPFEDLRHRGIRRRRRRRALAGVGVAAAVTIAVLAAQLPVGNLLGADEPPTIGHPKYIGVDRATDAMLRQKANMTGIRFATPTRWAATWEGDSGKPSYAVTLGRDGVRTTGPLRDTPFLTVRAGDEVLAMTGAPLYNERLQQNDPGWAQAVLVGLTAKGKLEKPLRWAPPTSTFADDEILMPGPIQQLLVLNTAAGTLRELKMPPQTDYTMPPIRDSSGRWWVIGGKNSGGGTYIYGTGNGGRTWDRTVLDPARHRGRLGVSPNGKTLVAYPFSTAADGNAPVGVKLSTDGGKHWKTVVSRVDAYLSEPVAFDDGTGMLLYQNAKQRELLFPGGRASFAPPEQLGELNGADGFVYGLFVEDLKVTTQVLISTDRGKTWTTFEPH
ncbi:MAG: hypothetical protein QOH03_116 [Kribbellaceae bacterium]|nr:hypothetical protein [Kribbellaceae bacterium]